MQGKRKPRPTTAFKSLWRVLHGATTTPAERRAACEMLRAAGLDV